MKVTIDYLPPSVNSYWKRGKGGNIYRTQEATNWLTYASAIIRQKKRTLFETPVEIYITVNYENEKRDLDGFCKLTLDCLQYAGVIKNDNLRYVHNIFLYKGERQPKGKGSLEVEVVEIEK